ncbi:unnamed protein product [Pleuronectes platessa]|uniref:Uncharacterized protein n=1 Tax=Pleuronectes platessa TaxID=8262 RepID=A0A9N7VL24_PLEPL|nr:unnamed protein product [Pleuronectes platessa]
MKEWYVMCWKQGEGAGKLQGKWCGNIRRRDGECPSSLPFSSLLSPSPALLFNSTSIYSSFLSSPPNSHHLLSVFRVLVTLPILARFGDISITTSNHVQMQMHIQVHRVFLRIPCVSWESREPAARLRAATTHNRALHRIHFIRCKQRNTHRTNSNRHGFGFLENRGPSSPRPVTAALFQRWNMCLRRGETDPLLR